jgi:hypothetical protein
MVEQRPFKALVLGSSPSQPRPLFSHLAIVFLWEIGSDARVRSNATKRKNAHKSAVHLTTSVNARSAEMTRENLFEGSVGTERAAQGRRFVALFDAFGGAQMTRHVHGWLNHVNPLLTFSTPMSIDCLILQIPDFDCGQDQPPGPLLSREKNARLQEQIRLPIQAKSCWADPNRPADDRSGKRKTDE